MLDTLRTSFFGKMQSVISTDTATGLLEKSKFTEQANSLFLNTVIFVLRTTEVIDRKKEIPKEISVESNPFFRPYTQLVKEGIENFHTSHPDIQLSWKRENVFSPKELAVMLKAPLRPDDIIHLQSILADPEQKNLIYEGMTIWEIVWLSLQKANLFITDTLAEFLINKMPTQVQEVVTGAQKHSSSSEVISKYRPLIEEVFNRIHQPLSITEILPIFLESNQGNIGTSLEEMASFLKSMARTGEKNVNRLEWFKSHIKDEYSPTLGYQNLPEEIDHSEFLPSGRRHSLFEKIASRLTGRSLSGGAVGRENMDFNLENQIGKPYHAANLVSLLNSFSPEVISVLAMGEYVQYAAEHGSHKMFADILLLKQLKEIEKYLSQFNTKPNENKLPDKLINPINQEMQKTEEVINSSEVQNNNGSPLTLEEQEYLSK